MRVKAEVVAEDEHEGGRRAILNFGHTVGHALEAASGYDLLHGEAVSLGMIAALSFGAARGITPAPLIERARRVLAAVGLPVDVERRLDASVLARVGVDKKRRGGKIRFVFVPAPGQTRLEDVTADELSSHFLSSPGGAKTIGSSAWKSRAGLGDCSPWEGPWSWVAVVASSLAAAGCVSNSGLLVILQNNQPVQDTTTMMCSAGSTPSATATGTGILNLETSTPPEAYPAYIAYPLVQSALPIPAAMPGAIEPNTVYIEGVRGTLIPPPGRDRRLARPAVRRISSGRRPARLCPEPWSA